MQTVRVISTIMTSVSGAFNEISALALRDSEEGGRCVMTQASVRWRQGKWEGRNRTVCLKFAARRTGPQFGREGSNAPLVQLVSRSNRPVRDPRDTHFDRYTRQGSNGLLIPCGRQTSYLPSTP